MQIDSKKFAEFVKKERNKIRGIHEQSISAYPAEYYKNHRCFSTFNGLFAISPEGEIESLIKYRNKNGFDLIIEAQQAGGKFLHCYTGKLPSIYRNAGFITKEIMPFDSNLAPEGWDTNKLGTPGYARMELAYDESIF